MASFTSTSTLSPFEKDTIREIINIGLARAADSFALIAQGRVLLSIPDLDLVDTDQMLRIIQHYDADHYFMVQSDIKGDFNGATLLAFSADDVRRLSEICLRMRGAATLVLSEMQRSLLLEISNILTGALVTQLANLLHASIYGAPPTTPGSDLPEALRQLMAHSASGLQPLIFTVITQFQDSAKQIELPLLLFFDRPTFVKMLETIKSASFRQQSHLK